MAFVPTSPCLLFFPDPVPAFKSWQDDNENGEAQLSPLAGRMVPLPLLPLEEHDEEDEGGAGQDASPSSSRSHPHLLARRFLDFGAHSSQRFLLQDPEATSPTKTHRYSDGERSGISATAVEFVLSVVVVGCAQAAASVIWLQRGHERRRFGDSPTYQEAPAPEEENQTV